MKIKYFLLGLFTGIVLTFVVFFVIGFVNQKFVEQKDVPIKYLEQPVSYEDKKETSFKIFQVIGNGALAMECSDSEYDIYLGNTVLILGENFYNDQIVNIKNPQRVGTYNYINNRGMQMTVPIIDGDTSR